MPLKVNPEEVLKLDGSRINWKHPPKATTRVKWTKKTTSGKDVTGSFRTIAHFNRLNNLAIIKFGRGIEVIQPPYNKGVEASKGTHDFDCCADIYIPGVSWWAQQKFFRANGFWCWYRHPPLFGNHIHGFTAPPMEGRVRADDFKMAGFKVGLYVDGGYSTEGRRVASAQIDDFVNHAFGLANQHGSNTDHTWFPDNLRDTIFDLDAYIAKRREAA